MTQRERQVIARVSFKQHHVYIRDYPGVSYRYRSRIPEREEPAFYHYGILFIIVAFEWGIDAL